jgi:hypothetical protein
MHVFILVYIPSLNVSFFTKVQLRCILKSAYSACTPNHKSFDLTQYRLLRLGGLETAAYSNDKHHIHFDQST